MVIMETRILERADRIFPSLGFSDHFWVPSVGYARGLRVLWNSNIIFVEMVAFTVQAVHTIVSQLSVLIIWQLMRVLTQRFEGVYRILYDL